MIWKVPPEVCKDRLCFILAGGPSLKGFDARVLYKKGFVIAINDSWRLAPRADMFYFCDMDWWDRQIAACPWSLDMTRSFHDMIYRGFWVAGNYRFADHPQVRALQLGGQLGLSSDPTRLCHGSNSGYQAINLAFLLGAKKIVLLGYDMRTRVVGGGPVEGGPLSREVVPGAPRVTERTHWHDEVRPDGFAQILKNSMLPCFDSLVEPLKAAGVEVINATPDSALTCWPMTDLVTVLLPSERATTLTPGDPHRQDLRDRSVLP